MYQAPTLIAHTVWTAWWYTAVIPELKRERQKGQKFKVLTSFTVRAGASLGGKRPCQEC